MSPLQTIKRPVRSCSTHPVPLSTTAGILISMLAIVGRGGRRGNLSGNSGSRRVLMIRRMQSVYLAAEISATSSTVTASSGEAEGSDSRETHSD